MTPQLDDAQMRHMTAMWADIARHQMARLTDTLDELRDAQADHAFRWSFDENPRPEWTEYAAQAVRTLTQHQFWQVGADK